MPENSKKDGGKKSILLRLSPELWNELAEMSAADFRSVNGEIEYLLSEAVRKRRGSREKTQE